MTKKIIKMDSNLCSTSSLISSHRSSTRWGTTSNFIIKSLNTSLKIRWTVKTCQSLLAQTFSAKSIMTHNRFIASKSSTKCLSPWSIIVTFTSIRTILAILLYWRISRVILMFLKALVSTVSLQRLIMKMICYSKQRISINTRNKTN